jgi:uncharacterized repeat protein (TIGR03806 family)
LDQRPDGLQLSVIRYRGEHLLPISSPPNWKSINVRRISHRLAAILVMQAAGLLLSACGGSDAEPDEARPPPSDVAAPSVPTNIVASASSPTSVVLTWTASTDPGSGATGVGGYEVFRNGAATAIGSTTNTTFTDTSVLPNTLYDYTVLAFDRATPPHSSAQSGPVSVTTPAAVANDATPPSLPANFRVTSVTSTQVNLAWTASSDPSGIGGYRIYRNGGTTPIVTTTTLTHTDNGLAPATNYTYEIVAFDASAAANATARTPSPALAATTAAAPNDATPPAPPTGLSAQPLSDTRIQLTWQASADTSGIREYRLYRGATLVTIVGGDVTPLQYTEEGLTASTAYTYEVTAVDNSPARNESALSVAATATTNSAPPAPDDIPPTTPGSFSATTTGTTSIRLNWTAASDASGIREYRLTRSPAFPPQAPDNSGIKILPANALTYADLNLAASTTYIYTITAVDNANPANASNSVSASARTNTAPDTTPPSVPANLAAQVLSSSAISLRWDPSTDASGISGYRVFRDGVQVNVAATNAYTDSGLTASTQYSYTVAAVDASPQQNVSQQTAGVLATTSNVPPDTTPPSAPTNVRAVAQSSSAILLSWEASTDASGISAYRIFRDGSVTPLATVGGSTLTFMDTQLVADRQYTYTVRALDGVAPTPNESVASAAASARTLVTPDTTPPTVPTGVVATAQGASSILVTWAASTDDSGIFGYTVYRDGVQVGLVSTRSFTDTGLAASTTYAYTVRATDNASPANVSAASAPVSATTQAPPPPTDTTPPSVPQNVTAAALSGSSIQVSWSASTDNASGVASYRVYRNGNATPVGIVNSPTTTFTDTGLTDNTLYSYRVSAVDGAPIPNISAQSAAASATTPDATPPSVPANVTAVAQSSTSILVAWSASTDASGISGYRVYRNGNASPLTTVTTTSFTDTGLASSTQYTYRVSAVDSSPAQNASAQSAAASATTQAGASGSGLDARPSNMTCLAGDAPGTGGALSIAINRVFPNVTLNEGVKLLQEPAGSQRWFAVQQGGLVRVWANNNTATASTFVNITSKVARLGTESGFLGMAFHPNWPADPRVYLSYNAGSSGNEVSRISEFRSTDGGATLDANSEVVLMTVNQPDDNHKGGDIAFGPDGYLYIGFGDGGGANDIDPGHNSNMGNGQYKQTLLGKMLRIAIGAQGQPYTIPSDNPFVGGAVAVNGSCATANCPEIWAYGMRNPWRWSFDRNNGDLWVGDVGQNAWEEVDKIAKGGNYGCREGAHASGNSCGSSPGPYLDPVAEYDHSAGLAITGGFVYRGSAIPALAGRYVFADYATGDLWTIPATTTPTMQVTAAQSLSTGYSVSSFGQGNDGELYIIDYTQGRIGKIVQGSGGGGGRTIPTLLSDTGCVNASNHQLPASGLIPFAPNAPFYSDGAVKQRWLALPNGSQIVVENSNDFTFPVGSVLMKNFTLGSQLVETRLFMRHNDGNWAGYTYEWNTQGTDATRVIGGKSVTINGQTWEFPSESQCLVCHTAVAGRTLGPEIGSFNGDLMYPATGRTANQLTTHNAIGTLTPPLTQPASALPVIPNPFGTAGTVSERARAYLHANCSYCHQPGGPTSVNRDFRYTTSLLNTNACDVAPTTGDLGIANARRIAPGDAARSVVVARVNRTDANAMPPLMRHTIDTAGVQLLTDWVNGLTSCN